MARKAKTVRTRCVSCLHPEILRDVMIVVGPDSGGTKCPSCGAIMRARKRPRFETRDL